MTRESSQNWPMVTKNAKLKFRESAIVRKDVLSQTGSIR
jgi:hypothetical protein